MSIWTHCDPFNWTWLFKVFVSQEMLMQTVYVVLKVVNSLNEYWINSKIFLFRGKIDLKSQILLYCNDIYNWYMFLLKVC